MDRIRIPNDATYLPLPLLDVALVAPIVSRVLLRATLPGRAIQAAALGIYAGSALQDWRKRRGVRKIDFMKEFGADLHHLEEMPVEAREAEARALAAELNEIWTPVLIPREELAVEVDRRLVEFIASITGQRVETSTEVRSFTVASLLFPFALGACDFLSGDIAIFRDTGIFEPHVIAHEFVHRKGYWRELEAQALAYFALVRSGEPVLVQSARAERLNRQLRALTVEDPAEYPRRVAALGLRPEIEADFLALAPPPGPISEKVSAVMKRIYDERMRITGQNGIRDYDVGFTNFLYTYESASQASESPSWKGRFPGSHAEPGD